MKKTVKLLLAAAAATLMASSCTKFLETTPTNKVSDILIWTDTQYADLYVNSFYSYIHEYGQFGSLQFSSNMTEGLTNSLKYGSPTPGSHYGDSNNYVFYPERITNSSSLLNTWPAAYNRIRRVNEFLSSLATYSTFDEQTNISYEAQARFFRAFLYFQLAKRHCNGNEGGVILYEDLNLVKDKEHATESETWDFIENDLLFAAQNLPKRWDSSNDGRVNRYMAYALLSRIELYAERWDKAEVAADSVIQRGGYALTDSYDDAWRGGNSEAIIQFKYDPVNRLYHQHEIYHVPFGDFTRIEDTEIGGTAVPTQEMVEEYEDKDGNVVDWSAWHVAGPVAARPPFENLEPRFASTVLYNGCTWKGNTMDITEKGQYGRFMNYRADGYTNGRTVTGYYMRKFLTCFTDDEFKNLDITNGKRGGATWVELRLAEVYLNRAEARMHTGGDALEDVNAVRRRVGLPDRTGLSGDALFAAIRHERKVELAYEGHLWWDMRRWKLAASEYNNYRCHGLKPAGSEGSYTFEYVDCDGEDRKFPERLYILPIPTSETNVNSAITQYPEWR